GTERALQPVRRAREPPPGPSIPLHQRREPDQREADGLGSAIATVAGYRWPMDGGCLGTARWPRHQRRRPSHILSRLGFGIGVRSSALIVIRSLSSHSNHAGLTQAPESSILHLW